MEFGMNQPASQPINEQPNSVELSVSTKGIWTGTLKVYAKTLDDALVQAKAKALEMEQWIKEKNATALGGKD